MQYFVYDISHTKYLYRAARGFLAFLIVKLFKRKQDVMPDLKALKKPSSLARRGLAHFPDKRETINPKSGYDLIASFEPSTARIFAATGWTRRDHVPPATGSDDALKKSLF
jgi:hypothetical protein